MAVETFDRGHWRSAAVGSVVAVAGRVLVEAAATRVRVSGRFYPVEPVVEAQGWSLQTKLAVGSPSLTGQRPPARLASTTVTLVGLDGSPGALRGPLHLELPTEAGSYHALASAAIPAGDVLRVTVDPRSVRHVDGRARP